MALGWTTASVHSRVGWALPQGHCQPSKSHARFPCWVTKLLLITPAVRLQASISAAPPTPAASAAPEATTPATSAPATAAEPAPATSAAAPPAARLATLGCNGTLRSSLQGQQHGTPQCVHSPVLRGLCMCDHIQSGHRIMMSISTLHVHPMNAWATNNACCRRCDCFDTTHVCGMTC
jgi:hypothetical protein